MQPKRITLPDGALLLLVEDHELPFINSFIEMHGGTRDLPAAKAGRMDLYGQVWRTSGSTRRRYHPIPAALRKQLGGPQAQP